MRAVEPGWDARFWAKVQKTDGCWLWTGHVTPEGYGRFSRQRRLVGPHRLSYEMVHGPIPDGMQVDHHHTCPKNCVNPDHLRLATQKQNMENLNGATARSKSGVRGVWWSEQRQRWCAQICHNYKMIHVGRYLTLEEAKAAVVAKRNELFTHSDMDTGSR